MQGLRQWVSAGAMAWLIAAAPAFAQEALKPPAAPKFEIQRFIVEGNTLLPREEVDAIVAPFAGKDRDFGFVQRALEALEEAYVSRGYSAVRVLIPEQDLVAGQVRLQVIEARVRNVRVENNRFFDEANVRAGLPALVPGEPPNTRRIGDNAQLVNENPAKQVNVRLEPTDQVGQVDAVVRVTDNDPSRVTLFADNSGNSATGQFRAGAGYQNANVGNLDHVLNAQYILSPTRLNDVTILGVGYRVPVYPWGGAVDAVFGYSDVNSGTVQDLFAVSGKGTIFGLRYSQILPRIEAYEQKLVLGLDYRAFKQNVVLIGTTGTLVPDITIHPVSLTYNGRWSRVGRDLSFFGSASRNISGGSDGGQPAFTAQRAGAEARYTVFRFGAAYTHALEGDLLLRAAFNAQYTDDLLIPGEQFGMGGADSVRGFHERDAVNDRGYRYSAEAYLPDFGTQIGAGWRGRAVVFYDGAQGKDNVPQRNARNGLAGAGIGVRISQGRSLSLRADWAVVMNGANRPTGSNRLHFAVAYSF